MTKIKKKKKKGGKRVIRKKKEVSKKVVKRGGRIFEKIEKNIGKNIRDNISKGIGKKVVGKRLPRTIKKADHQVGNSNVDIDRLLFALPPGKRLSKHGKPYYEYRKNKSDLHGGI